MGNTEKLVGTLVSISGTMAGIGLTIVSILSAKASVVRIQSLADDIFLFASLGFILVVALAYVVQKDPQSARARRFLTVAEWMFSMSLAGMVAGSFVLVYIET